MYLPVTTANRKATRIMGAVGFMLKANYGLIGNTTIGLKYIFCMTLDSIIDFSCNVGQVLSKSVFILSSLILIDVMLYFFDGLPYRGGIGTLSQIA